MSPLPAAAPSEAPHLRPGRLAHVLVAAPERIALVTVALAVAAGLAVTAGAHVWFVVLPAAALLVAIAWRPLAPARAASLTEARAAAVAVGGALVWTVVNIALAAEYVLVVRDPGFLTLSGLWLVDHPSTDVPTLGAVDAAAAGSQVLPDASEAWNLKDDVIQPQGAKMLPATIAIGGWIAGDTGVLAANVVIGAVGILAVYALGRRFLGPYAALVPAGALALTVAHIGLSRPAYTEPLTLLLVIASLLWAWRGVSERSLVLLAAGGAASGATMLIRIDGTAFAIGACAGVLVAALLVDASGAWRQRAVAGFVLPQVLLAAVGVLSLWLWSTEYIERLDERSTLLNLAYAGTAAAALLVAALTRPGPVDRALVRLRTSLRGPWSRGAGLTAASAVAVLLVGLASRPLWTTAHRSTSDPRDIFGNGVTESFQAAQGLPIEPTRTYAESTVTWLSYHLTWPLIALAIVGFAVAARRMVRADAAWAVLLGGVLAPSLLYLVRPSIIPDQIWAIRRLEPATIPGFVLAAGVGAWALVGLVRRARLRTRLRVAAAVIVVGLPVTTWLAPTPGGDYPVSSAVNVTTREMIGARDMLAELCALDPGRPIVLIGSHELYGGLRTACDVPVVLALADQSAQDLAGIAQAWSAQPLVLTRDADRAPWTTAPEPVAEARVAHSAYTLEGLPRSVYQRTYSWYGGVVGEDGAVVPLTAP